MPCSGAGFWTGSWPTLGTAGPKALASKGVTGEDSTGLAVVARWVNCTAGCVTQFGQLGLSGAHEKMLPQDRVWYNGTRHLVGEWNVTPNL
jgi:hypothetical protein